ncbi:MAG: hypothetical protein V2A79_12350 [Planctomycetota bacterium]
MAIVAGIDEAGYGPLLGPLVVTGVAFQVPDDSAELGLWEMLKASVTRRPSAKDLRLPILDSKKLYATKAGLGNLERTALVMLSTSGHRPSTFRQLLKLVAPQALDDLSCYPWYDAFDVPLPLRCAEAEIATRANAVRRDLAARGVRLVGVFCEPLLEGHYNRLVAGVRNKAVVALGVVLRVVQHFLSRAGTQRVVIHVDRQGGRAYYRRPLMSAFPDYPLRIVEETGTRSAYELSGATACHPIAFVTHGEDRHLPVALASIYSKYLRELFMGAFNDFWARQVQRLRPTAGYYTDARRFLRDIEAAVQALRIDRGLLVRAR